MSSRIFIILSFFVSISFVSCQSRVKLNRDKTILYFYDAVNCTARGDGVNCKHLLGDLVSITSDEIKHDVLSIITWYTWTSGVQMAEGSKKFVWSNNEPIPKSAFYTERTEFENSTDYCVLTGPPGFLYTDPCVYGYHVLRQYRIGVDHQSIFDTNLKKLDKLSAEDYSTLLEISQVVNQNMIKKVNSTKSEFQSSKTVNMLLILVIVFCSVVTIHVIQDLVRVLCCGNRNKK